MIRGPRRAGEKSQTVVFPTYAIAYTCPNVRVAIQAAQNVFSVQAPALHETAARPHDGQEKRRPGRRDRRPDHSSPSSPATPVAERARQDDRRFVSADPEIREWQQSGRSEPAGPDR